MAGRGPFVSSTMGSAIVLRLLYALRLLRCRANRRKPDYSGTVDHLAVRVETRSVAWAVPGFLRVIPVDDAKEVRTHRRKLVHCAAIIAIDGDLSSAGP